MQFSSLPINSSLQNNPTYKLSLKSENIEILTMAILKMAAIRDFFGQNILPTLLIIYAKSCGNPFGSFRFKWGQRFWHICIFTVSMATVAILKIPRPEFLKFVSFIGLDDKKSACTTYSTSLSAHWPGKTSAGILGRHFQYLIYLHILTVLHITGWTPKNHH